MSADHPDQPAWRVPEEPDGAPALDDDTVRALYEVSRGAADMQDRIDREVRRRQNPQPWSEGYEDWPYY